MPACWKVQSNFGPFVGQFFSSPVSFETSVRSAPRQAGQSSARALPASAQQTVARRSSVDVFIGGYLSLVKSTSRQCEGNRARWDDGRKAGCNKMQYKLPA